MARTINASIDYDNEINKLDPHLLSPRRLSSRIQPLLRGRQVVLKVVAHQCIYFTFLLHKLRNAYEVKRTRVGIVGGGCVGVEIAQALVLSNWPTQDLAISTRQPNDTRWMSRVDESVERYHDNVKLVEECDVIILAMPPSQLTSVGIQIKHKVSQGDSVLVSVLAGVGVERVSKVCDCPWTLQTRISSIADIDVNSKEFEGAKIAATQLAEGNSLGLKELCLLLERFALNLGFPNSDARQYVVDLVLGNHDQCTWTGDDHCNLILRTTQQVFSTAINQLDVPCDNN